MLCLLSLALAADPVVPVDLPDTWEEVTPVDDLATGLLAGPSAWAQTPWGCAEVTLHHDEDERYDVLRCEAEVDGLSLRCVEQGQLGLWGTGRTRHCTATRGDETTGTGTMGGGERHTARPRLVEHTAERAVWRQAWGATAEPERVERVSSPCLPGSGVHGDSAGRRECFRSTGVVVRKKPGGARGRALFLAEDPTPVDCRQPCPDNAGAVAVKAANDALSGRLFSEAEAATESWFVTREACEAAPASPVTEPTSASPCDPAGERWWESPDP